MPVRQGGSYTANKDTGEETLVERTELPDLVTVEPAPDVPTGPAAPVAAEPEASASSHRRRGASTQPQE